MDGNSQSDVTVEDMGELSRVPKRTKTGHVVGHCQKVCQEGGKVYGTTDVAFFVSRFVQALKSRDWGTDHKPLPTNWSGREKTFTELEDTLGKEGIRLIDRECPQVQMNKWV